MGSSYVSVGDGGPDSIVNTALQVKSAGDDFASKASPTTGSSSNSAAPGTGSTSAP